MAIPIFNDWEKYFANPHEGLGSSYKESSSMILYLE
jgi:hypothetical protein